MKCTGKEWDTCRVEKMGCTGCYYDEIEAGEYIRTESGHIFKVDEEKKVLAGIKFLNVQYGKIKKHSKNIIDLIEVGDYVNGYKVSDKESTLLITNVKGIDRSGYHIPISQYGDGIKSIVTKELFKKEEFKYESDD